MKKILVKIPGRVYPIFVGSNVSKTLLKFLKKEKIDQLYVVFDSKLKKQSRLIAKNLNSKTLKCTLIQVSAGEKLKEVKNIYPIYSELIRKGANRQSVIMALGGGSVGDAVGFVAATFLRGIRWIGAPTTLLAQVDSSVGGKTGINHEGGKNLIGAFHQPIAVFCDTEWLWSLSQREIISGLGEAIKYGLVYDPQFYRFIKDHLGSSRKIDTQFLQKVVARSLTWKSQVVAQDEMDLKGVREFLNFGHTLAHGLESETKYKKFQHGEAVILGMRFALALSFLKSYISEKLYKEIDGVLKSISLPKIKNENTKSIFKIMKSDKKVRNGKINFVLLKSLGRAISVNTVTETELKWAWSLITKDAR